MTGPPTWHRVAPGHYVRRDAAGRNRGEVRRVGDGVRRPGHGPPWRYTGLGAHRWGAWTLAEAKKLAADPFHDHETESP